MANAPKKTKYFDTILESLRINGKSVKNGTNQYRTCPLCNVNKLHLHCEQDTLYIKCDGVEGCGLSAPQTHVVPAGFSHLDAEGNAIFCGVNDYDGDKPRTADMTFHAIRHEFPDCRVVVDSLGDDKPAHVLYLDGTGGWTELGNIEVSKSVYRVNQDMLPSAYVAHCRNVHAMLVSSTEKPVTLVKDWDNFNGKLLLADGTSVLNTKPDENGVCLFEPVDPDDMKFNRRMYATQEIAGRVSEEEYMVGEVRQAVERMFPGHPEMVDYMEMMVANVALGNHFQLANILIGDGSNGKTFFINGVHKLFGKYAHAAQEDVYFGNKYGSSHNEKHMHFSWALVSTLSEAPKSHDLRWVMETLKRVTGGDMMSASKKGKDSIEFSVRCTPMVALNDFINFGSVDESLRRRLIMIPCETLQTNGVNVIKEVDKFYIDYADHWFAMLRRGLRLVHAIQPDGRSYFQNKKIPMPQPVIDERDKHFEASGSFTDMFHTVCELDPEGYMFTSEIALVINIHAEAMMQKKCSNNWVGSELGKVAKALGLVYKKRKRGKAGPFSGYYGCVKRKVPLGSLGADDDESNVAAPIPQQPAIPQAPAMPQPPVLPILQAIADRTPQPVPSTPPPQPPPLPEWLKR